LLDGGRCDIVDINAEPPMPDLLIRDIDPEMNRSIEERARRHERNLSDEVKALIQQGLSVPDPEVPMGTWISSLVRPEDRGDDLVFEYHGEMSPPPDFE
jgi:plasmid stability protein